MNPDTLARLEKLGVQDVRLEMLSGRLGLPGSPNRSEVEDWIRSKDAAESAASSAKRAAREEETLSIARKASFRADRANRIAWIAASIAILSIIKDIVIVIFKK